MAKKSEQGRTVSEGPGEARRQELNMALWAWLVPVLALAALCCSKWTGFEA